MKIKKAALVRLGMNPNTWLKRYGKLFIHKVMKAARVIYHRGVVDNFLGVCGLGVGDLKIECFKSDENTASVYLFGLSDNPTHFDLYSKYVQPSSIAVDVGANVGIHSLVMSRCVGATGAVYSYEPSKTIFERLSRNVLVNDTGNIVVNNVAVGHHSGEIGFADHSNGSNIGISHIDEASSLKVPLVTLDDHLEGVGRIGFIKIDVEGYELDVIKGAQKILEEFRPVLVMEFNAERYDLTELLAALPYDAEIYIIPETYYDKLEKLAEVDIRQSGYCSQCNLLVLPVLRT
ncbi:MAG: FkbM family methyltransferase [Gammaproteobacteria bacterium]